MQIKNAKKRKRQYITLSPFETKNLGEVLAKKILKEGPQKKALVFALIGDLGGGKTTFLQGFAKGLGIKERILSPTFVILKKFQVSLNSEGITRSEATGSCSKFQEFYHIDCYRVKKPKEILDLGFKEVISEPQNIVAIEWADRVREILPEDTITLKFKLVDKVKREITISC